MERIRRTPWRRHACCRYLVVCKTAFGKTKPACIRKVDTNRTDNSTAFSDHYRIETASSGEANRGENQSWRGFLSDLPRPNTRSLPVQPIGTGVDTPPHRIAVTDRSMRAEPLVGPASRPVRITHNDCPNDSGRPVLECGRMANSHTRPTGVGQRCPQRALADNGIETFVP
jgi:hypothetical protein